MQNKWILTVCLFAFLVAGAQEGKQEFLKETFPFVGDTLNYRVLFPKDFDDTKKYPLLLFLHGAGERGSDNEAQLVHGSSLFLNVKNREEFPAIVVFPQCRKNDYWSNAQVDRSPDGVKLKFQNGGEPTKALSGAMALLESFLSQPFVKKEQVYVGGLSMGGMGTFEILYRMPETFAAAIAICGGGNPDTAKVYAKNTPLWIFHGAKDDVVNPIYSLEMAEALLAAGGFPQLTIYDDANHNSWDPAFAEPELLPWIFQHTKQ